MPESLKLLKPFYFIEFKNVNAVEVVVHRFNSEKWSFGSSYSLTLLTSDNPAVGI